MWWWSSPRDIVRELECPGFAERRKKFFAPVGSIKL